MAAEYDPLLGERERVGSRSGNSLVILDKECGTQIAGKVGVPLCSTAEALTEKLEEAFNYFLLNCRWLNPAPASETAFKLRSIEKSASKFLQLLQPVDVRIALRLAAQNRASEQGDSVSGPDQMSAILESLSSVVEIAPYAHRLVQRKVRPLIARKRNYGDQALNTMIGDLARIWFDCFDIAGLRSPFSSEGFFRGFVAACFRTFLDSLPADERAEFTQKLAPSEGALRNRIKKLGLSKLGRGLHRSEIRES